MTEKAVAAARRVASPGTEIIAVTSGHGPVSIEGYYDEAMSLSSLLQAIRQHQDHDAVVIACFDDTGLDAARCLTDKPVVGIGEAGYRMAAMLSNRFAVVICAMHQLTQGVLQHAATDRLGLANQDFGVGGQQRAPVHRAFERVQHVVTV
jgi:Asp/Glu/hydantoin racemase